MFMKFPSLATLKVVTGLVTSMRDYHIDWFHDMAGDPFHKVFMSKQLKTHEILFAVMSILLIESGHKLAHVTTAQSCNILASACKVDCSPNSNLITMRLNQMPSTSAQM